MTKFHHKPNPKLISCLAAVESRSWAYHQLPRWWQCLKSGLSCCELAGVQSILAAREESHGEVRAELDFLISLYTLNLI